MILITILVPRMLETGEVSKWCSNVGILMNILRIIVCKTKKLLQLLDGRRLWPGINGLYLARISINTACFDNMPKAFHRLLTKEIFSFL